jgi:transcriptional regulator with XRE-family HTH domain
MIATPPVRRRIVGAALRRYRQELGFGLDDAARLLECDRSKISRIETGQRGIRNRELRDLLTGYGADKQVQDTIRTDPDIASRPLDAICARQFCFEFLDNYTRALMSAGFTVNRRPFPSKEQFTDFLMSLPSRRVSAMLQFHYLKDGGKHWKINDLRDNHALSKAIPYCDIVVTDSEVWDIAVNRAKLNQEFGTAIFRRLTDLSTYLR